MQKAGARAAAALALALAFALVTGACGGGDSSTATDTTVTTSAAPSTSRAPASTTATSPTTTAPVATGPTASRLVLEGGSEPDRYSYKVAFPQVSGVSATTVQATINNQIQAEVRAAIDQFVEGAMEFGASAPAVGGTDSGLEGDYEVARLDDRLASFRLRLSQFFAGAAHPGTVLLTFNYDLGTGDRLTLDDLFTAGSPYLMTLSDLSRQLLNAQPGFNELQDFVLPGTEPKPENFDGFTLTDQDLVITFDESQVGPYAIGTPHVSIPFASLRTLLDPTGPLRISN